MEHWIKFHENFNIGSNLWRKTGSNLWNNFNTGSNLLRNIGSNLMIISTLAQNCGETLDQIYG